VTYGRIMNYGYTQRVLSLFSLTSECYQRHSYVVYFISVHLLWLGTSSDPLPPQTKPVQPSCMTDTLPPRKQFSILPNFVALKMEVVLSTERP
jgi:hypothetical protein